MKRKLLVSLFSLCAVLTILPSCKALSGLLPVIGDIIGVITKAKEAVEHIDRVAQAYFAVNPDEAAQVKYAKAKAVTDNALNVVLRVSEGVEDASQEDIDAAWSNFREAFTSLIAVISDIGFRVQIQGTLDISGQQGMPYLSVPDPGDFR